MDQAHTWLPRGLAVAAFCLYALAAPSGLYWLDSAELTAAAVGLGSPHPTGFPLFCVLGKLAQLLPIGEIAFRLNLLSAASAALATLWLTRLAFELSHRDLPGLIGALCAGATLAVTLVFARQATVVEIYAPNAALLAGGLLLFARVARGGGPRDGLLLALVCGLGLGMHTGFLLLGPSVAALLIVRLRSGARWPLSAPLVTALIAGALYMYLPVRSATGRVAAIDWGHPRTVDALYDHMSAQRIRAAFGDQMQSTDAEVIASQLGGLSEQLLGGIGPLLPLAALFGFVWLFQQRRSRWTASALAVLVVGDFAYALWINPMGTPDLQNTVPLTMGLAVAGGVGIGWFARYLGAAGPYIGGVVSLIVFAMPAMANLPEIWRASSGDLPRAFCEAGLEATPARGVALVQNDSTAAGMIYLGVAENARPDVAVLVRQHLRDRERVRAVLATSGFETATGDLRDPYAVLLARARAITWEIGSDSLPAGADLVVGAPLARLVRTQAERERARPLPITDDAPAARVDIRAALDVLARIFGHQSHTDRAARRMHAVTLTSLGRMAFGRADLELAEVLFAAANGVDPDWASAWINRGVVAARRADYQQAVEYTETVLDLPFVRLGPQLTARVNAGRYAIQLGDDDRARGHIEHALRYAHQRADIWALAALLDLRAGRPERAFERLARARAIDPAHPDVVHLQRQLQRPPE